MNTHVTAALAVAFCIGLASVSRAQPGSGSITGVVTKSPGGEPAAFAVVKLASEPPSVAPAGEQTQSVTTGADGAFRFDDVEARPYWVVANLPGYLPAEYGQRSPTGTGISVDVANGQRVAVRITMWPTSGISGRVVDADGDAVGRVQVLALRLVYRDGQLSTTIAQTVTTDDRGEYRMFWLTPGAYRVAARPWDHESFATAVNIGPPRRFSTAEQGTSPLLMRRKAADGSLVEETAIPIYAPSTPDQQLASTMTLAPGESATNVDIQLAGSRVPARHIRGIVANPTGVPGQIQVLAVPRAMSPFAAISSAPLRSDGSFDLMGLAAGPYTLYTQDGSGAQPLEIADSDIDNIVLTVPPPIILNARVAIEGAAGAGRIDASSLHVQLTRDPDVLGAPSGGPRFNPAPDPDGKLALNGIGPGNYRVSVTPLRQNSYLKSVRLGTSDVLAEGLHLWAPVQATLDIVVSLNGAEIDGTALDDRREPASNVVVVAVPGGANSDRRDAYRRVMTDRRGHFTMQGLVPGDYTLYAWDDVERGAWESPEFLRGFEGRGRFVRVREGKNDPAELTVVSR